jgi:tol-pal system protein YbgF
MRREDARTQGRKGVSSRLRALAPLRPCVLASVLFAACATKGQVQLLQTEVQTLRVESARRDSARAAALAAVIGLQNRILDSLAAGREALRQLDARMKTELTDVQRQLLQVQELTGQSQTRLSELKAQLDTRAEQQEAAGLTRPATAPDTAGRAPAPALPAAPVTTADQMYFGALQQFRRGSLTTARRGFQEFLKTYPTSEQVPDALNFVAESFANEAPDSAVVYYTQVVQRFPKSPRASTALYRIGRIEEARRNVTAARTYYERILKEYPQSNEADLARDRLKTLRP